MTQSGRKGGARTGAPAVLVGIALLCLASLSLMGEDKRLEVTAEKAAVHLDPDEKSPLVASLEKGSPLTLASDIKLRMCWLYVYFESPSSGKTRSGYVREDAVRRLVPAVKMIHIASEDEVMNPKELDLYAPYLPSIEWGISKDRIVRREGRPYKQESVKEGEILQYRREVVNKRCLVEYVFGDGRLVATKFYLLEKYVDRNRYIEEYNQIKEFLNEKVGVPRADRTIWQDRALEHQNGSLGQALNNGHLEFSAEWVFRDTEVHLILARADSRVLFGAEIYDVKVRNPASF